MSVLRPGRGTLGAGLVALLLPWVLGGCMAALETRADPAAEPCAIEPPQHPQATPVKLCPYGSCAGLVDLLEDVAGLKAQGQQAVRDALADPSLVLPPAEIGRRGLRKALLLLTLDDSRQEAEALALLKAHRARLDTPLDEALLAGLLEDEVRARKVLRTSLAQTRMERDAAQRQLEELKAIEQQIRDRSRTPDLEIPQAQ